jgi:protein TonB
MPPSGGDRRPLWLSVLAGLALHAGLALWWWVRASVPAPVVAPPPMTVRLAETAQAGVTAAPKAQATARPRTEAARPQPVSPAPPVVSPRARAEPAALTKPPSPAAAPTPAPTQALSAPLTPNPAPAAVAEAPRVASTGAVPTTPLTTSTPSASTSSAAGNVSTSATTADSRAPVDLPSASVRYLVPPVLTFPPGSEDMGESGSVTLRFLVDEKGVPIKIERVKSSGYPRLDQQAVSVIRRARFVPHLVQGEPRAFWVTQPFNFVLH